MFKLQIKSDVKLAGIYFASKTNRFVPIFNGRYRM